MSTQLLFEITLDSDYHVGAGYGDGVVDSALLRDGDGLPVIRGSTVVGLLRDAVWQLLQTGALSGVKAKCARSGLTGKDVPPFCAPDSDPCPVCRLFGTPREPKHWRISSARPVDQRWPQPPEKGKTAGGTLVQRARVSPRSRRAEARKLFSQEQGGASWSFSFTATTSDQGRKVLEEAALLVAAARAVRGLGRARRRGWGECRIHLKDREAEATWLDRFKAAWLEGETIAARPETALATVAASQVAPSGDPVRVYLIARADEPILIARRSPAGNEFETVEAVTGTALLGALASETARSYDVDDGARQAFVDLFLRGRIRFSPLYPARHHNDVLVPTIPAPLDLLTCKAFPGYRERPDPDEVHAVISCARAAVVPENCPDCARVYKGEEIPLKPLSGFVTVYYPPQQVRPQRRHEMHIGVDPATGRVHAQDLYGYVSLEAGQYFWGELRCADAAAWQALRDMADLPEAEEPFVLRVGKATRRGHGRMTLVWMSDADYEMADPWRGPALHERVPPQETSSELVMTLLTDAVLPDHWLQQRIGFDEGWLHELLRAPVTIIQAFARARQVDSFYAHLGLPRFRDLALAAGSAVGFRFKDSPPTDLHQRLARLEEEGIGLRRREGFGQVVFNHPLYDQPERLGTNYLLVPAALEVSTQSQPVEVVVAEFQGDWGRVLGKIKPEDMWKKESFEPIARLVHHEADGSLDRLKRRLRDGDDGTFGQPSTLLGYDLGGPPRDKKLVRETRQGRQKIINLLDELVTHKTLAEHPDLAPQLRRLGVQMLADRVAQGAAAARAEKETAQNKEATA